MHFRCRFAIIIKHRATRAVRTGQKMNMGAFPSGQWGQTVNLLLNASVVRIHQLPPKKIHNLGCGSFFVLELVGFEQVGRPQAAKNSPAGCFLDRGLRIHQLPPKGCDKNVVTAFFLCYIAENRHLRRPIFKVRFTVLSNRFRAVVLFCLRHREAAYSARQDRERQLLPADAGGHRKRNQAARSVARMVRCGLRRACR